jgi:hypothetical protein
VQPILEHQLQDAYTWARERLMRRRIPPQHEPPERCPWPLAQLLDERWWSCEAPARLP